MPPQAAEPTPGEPPIALSPLKSIRYLICPEGSKTHPYEPPSYIHSISILKKILTQIKGLIYLSRLKRVQVEGGEFMAVRRSKKKTTRRKATKKKATRKKTTKRKPAKKKKTAKRKTTKRKVAKKKTTRRKATRKAKKKTTRKKTAKKKATRKKATRKKAKKKTAKRKTAKRKTTKKKAVRKKKTVKRKKAKKPARKKGTTKKATILAKRRVSRPKPIMRPKPAYSCALCGVEVAITNEGLGISRLICCGRPMTRRR
jgi:hypothetical protein